MYIVDDITNIVGVLYDKNTGKMSTLLFPYFPNFYTDSSVSTIHLDLKFRLNRSQTRGVMVGFLGEESVLTNYFI